MCVGSETAADSGLQWRIHPLLPDEPLIQRNQLASNLFLRGSAFIYHQSIPRTKPSIVTQTRTEGSQGTRCCSTN